MRLAARMLVRRPAALLATFLACLFAVGLVTTCGALLESGLRYHGSVARYSRAPVVVAAPELRHVYRDDGKRKADYASLDAARPLPATLAAQLRQVAGVEAVVGDSAIAAHVQGAGGAASLDLHAWGATRLGAVRLLAGSAPVGGGRALLDERTADRVGARVGSEVRVWTAAGATPVTVTGIATAPERTEASAYLDAAAARGLLGRAPQVLGVLPRPGVPTKRLAAAVRAVVAPYATSGDGVFPQVFVGAERGRAETGGVADTRVQLVAMSAAFGGTALLVAGLVIANTVGLAVRQRLRDIALLRAVAATPRQVRRMVGGQVLAVAVLATLPGVLLGVLLAGRLRDGFVDHGIAPAVFDVHVSWLPELVAGAATLVVAVAAARVASVRPSRIRPTAALTESVLDRSRLGAPRFALGVISAGGAVAVCAVAARVPAAAESVAIATISLCTLAVAFLGPFVLRLVAATLGRLAAGCGQPGRLAAAAPSDVHVVPASAYRTALGAERQANGWADQVITVVLVGYVALAAVNTLIVHTLARRREFGVLRLGGATRRQLRGSLAIEHALLLGTAVVLGAGTAAAALLPSVHAVTGSVRPYLPTLAWVGVLAALALATASAVAIPARLAMRGRAIDAAAASE
jgi:putative ABC transport system permease protein